MTVTIGLVSLLVACQPKPSAPGASGETTSGYDSDGGAGDDDSSSGAADTADTTDTADTAGHQGPYYIVSNAGSGAMRKYDLDGRYIGDLVAPNSFLPGASQIEVAPDNRTLLVGTFTDEGVWQVDLETGADLGPLPGEDFLVAPSVFSYRADGALLVSDFIGAVVYAYDFESGEWLGEAFETGHQVNPHEVVPVGDDYLVADYGAGSITRYDADGAFQGVIANGAELRGPLGMLLTPDGERLLVSNNANGTVTSYNPITGEYLGALVSGIGLAYPEGLAITPDGELLVASPQNTTIFRVDIETGEVLGEFEHVDGDEGTVDVLLVQPD